jgi:hypothetical protein
MKMKEGREGGEREEGKKGGRQKGGREGKEGRENAVGRCHVTERLLCDSPVPGACCTPQDL